MKLSPHQNVVLNHLGIDAWYLHALKHSDVNYQQTQHAIDEIVDELNTTLVNVESAESSAKNHLSSDTITESVPRTVATFTDAVIADVKEKQITTTEGVAEKQADSVIKQSTVTVDVRNLEPIVLGNQQTVNQLSRDVYCPDNYQANLCQDWQALDEQISQQVSDKKRLDSQGSRSASVMIVVPPVMESLSAHCGCLNEGEQALLTAILASQGIDIKKVYITPLLKQTPDNRLDPSEQQLNQHLPWLWSEFLLVKPTWVVLMGGVVCQSVLQTSAVLSALIPNQYQLINQTLAESPTVVCLPELAYFLNLPAEKAWLWQRLKPLFNHAS